MSRYYMGALALSKKHDISLATYETLEDAIEAVSTTVGREGVTRYVVKVVAEIAPVVPVRVTLAD